MNDPNLSIEPNDDDVCDAWHGCDDDYEDAQPTDDYEAPDEQDAPSYYNNPYYEGER